LASPEFGSKSGKKFIIVRALYGLKSSGAVLQSFLAEALHNIEYITTLANLDVWLHPAVKPDRFNNYKTQNNEAVYKNCSIPELMLKKKYHLIAHYRNREAVTTGRVHIAKENTKTNLADIFTKTMASKKNAMVDLVGTVLECQNGDDPMMKSTMKGGSDVRPKWKEHCVPATEAQKGLFTTRGLRNKPHWDPKGIVGLSLD
jgi:hypothetical protein